jgi:hypothetical protein
MMRARGKGSISIMAKPTFPQSIPGLFLSLFDGTSYLDLSYGRRCTGISYCFSSYFNMVDSCLSDYFGTSLEKHLPP